MITFDLMKIRMAQLEDLPHIRAIYNEAILHSNAVYDENPKSEVDMLSWWSSKQMLSIPIVVIEIDNAIAGYGSYSQFRPWEGFRFCAEHTLYVHSEYRGKGLGKVLLTQIIQLATKKNYKSLVAGIDSENETSIILHKKMGFVDVGTFKNAGYKNGSWLDLTMLQKQL